MRLTAVVGASRGIGRHLALDAARRGDAVVAGARDGALLRALEAEAGASLRTIEGDLLVEGPALESLVDTVKTHHGPVTLLVCAATIGPVGPLGAVDPADWGRALETNVVGPVRILSRTLPHLGADDVVVLFSGGGVGGPRPQPRVSAYTTSKAALTHVVEVTAAENPDGPVVVAVAPGPFPTDFTAAVLQADPELAGVDLLADVTRTSKLPFDASHLDRLLRHLEAAPRRALSGRTLSAARDSLAALDALDAADRDLYRLRRVDGTSVRSENG